MQIAHLKKVIFLYLRDTNKYRHGRKQKKEGYLGLENKMNCEAQSAPTRKRLKTIALEDSPPA